VSCFEMALVGYDSLTIYSKLPVVYQATQTSNVLTYLLTYKCPQGMLPANFWTQVI